MSLSRFSSGLLILLFLSGCGFGPLYGKNNARIVPELSAIKITPIKDRSGQILRNYLLNDLTPRGEPQKPRYTLRVTLTESIQNLGIQKDETATRANLINTVDYKLTRKVDGADIYSGISLSTSSYDILTNQFANLAAEQDARNHNLKRLSEEIKLNLSFSLSKPKKLKKPAAP